MFAKNVGTKLEYKLIKALIIILKCRNHNNIQQLSLFYNLSHKNVLINQFSYSYFIRNWFKKNNINKLDAKQNINIYSK